MKKILLIALALLVTLYTNAITVTITVDEGFDNFAIIEKMQTNLGQVLTEINNAYHAKVLFLMAFCNVEVMAFCPTTLSNVVGLYFLAETTKLSMNNYLKCAVKLRVFI